MCVSLQITKLRIGDDGTGRGRTMFVEEVIVTSKQGDTVVFPCKCWLGKDDDNRKIIRELIPGKPVPEALEGKLIPDLNPLQVSLVRDGSVTSFSNH